VYALVAATGVSEGTLVFGAHYDTVPGSPGANDNATGIAVALALARQLQDVPCRRFDVIVALFDQEEIGLVGSAAFAQALVDADEPVISVHTIDQQGWDADGDRRIEIERPDAGLLEFYADASADLPEPIELVPTRTGSTDHVSFRAAGFAAVGITEEYVSGDTTPHYHAPSDTFDTIDFAYLVSSTTLVNHAFARALSGS
jgi:Zn-dependent M28 family amino/carboxypeptidase